MKNAIKILFAVLVIMNACASVYLYKLHKNQSASLNETKYKALMNENYLAQHADFLKMYFPEQIEDYTKKVEANAKAE